MGGTSDRHQRRPRGTPGPTSGRAPTIPLYLARHSLARTLLRRGARPTHSLLNPTPARSSTRSLAMVTHCHARGERTPVQRQRYVSRSVPLHWDADRPDGALTPSAIPAPGRRLTLFLLPEHTPHSCPAPTALLRRSRLLRGHTDSSKRSADTD